MSIFIPSILPVCARKEALLLYQLFTLVRAKITGEQVLLTGAVWNRLQSRLAKTARESLVTSFLLTAILVAYVVEVFCFPRAPWIDLAVFVPEAKEQLLSGDAQAVLFAFAQTVKASFFHHNWLHLLTNLVGLFAAGMALERRIGSVWFLSLYVVSSLAGYSLLILLSADGYASGASEAVWGVLAAFALVFSRCAVWSFVLLPPFIPIPFKATVRLALGVFFVLKLADAYLNLQGQTIQYAHFSGAAVGVCFALVWLSIKGRKC